jgi:hypothetical protein
MDWTDNGALSVPDDLLAQVKREGHELVLESVRARDLQVEEPAIAAPPAPVKELLDACPHCQQPLAALDRKFGNCMSCHKPLMAAGRAETQARVEVRI